MPKKQTDKLQNETLHEDDLMLLNIQFSLKGGQVGINREEVGHALLNPDTHVTAIAVMTLLHYFVDKETFLKGMKKTARNINKTMEKLDQYLAMVENIEGRVHYEIMCQHLAFILKLRVVSALLVMFYHHCHFFCLHQDFCSRLANNPPVDVVPLISSFLESLPINLGHLGVAIFFLISGFLMPLTAQGKTRREFLKARIRRIWIPYILAFLLKLCWVYWNSQEHFRDFPWSFDHILSSLMFMRDIIGYPFIDGIVWTLEVEIKFYLLCWLVFPWLVREPKKFVTTIIALSCLSIVLFELRDLFPAEIFVQRSIRIFFRTMRFICFMGLGSLMSYGYQKKLPRKVILTVFLCLAVLFCVHCVIMGYENSQWKEWLSYGLALVVFIGCYMLREKFSNKVILAWFGKISYSLYLVHGVPGFVVMYWMMNQDVDPLIAMIAAILYSLISANVFYLVVEKRIKRKLK